MFSNREITKRTIVGLRGNDPVQQHVNTILDYSMYWIISIANYYQSTADGAFVRMVYPKMKTMMAFLEGQLDENGFIIGRPGDWIFVDWSEMDKTGALCAEQMLFVMCYRTMAQMQALTGDGQEDYAAKEKELLKKIEAFFWDEEKKAYIDSFSSRKHHVTRHANLFAILFGIADETRCGQIYESVIANDAITQITTPYFKFYELEALCRLGKKQEVLQRMKEYWGAILAEGTGTIWEEYDPKQTGPESIRCTTIRMERACATRGEQARSICSDAIFLAWNRPVRDTAASALSRKPNFSAALIVLFRLKKERCIWFVMARNFQQQQTGTEELWFIRETSIHWKQEKQLQLN